MNGHLESPLAQPLELPCGAVLKNRIAKAAMSDALGDGCGYPTDAQAQLYARWAAGGTALSILGEAQGSPDFAENPGNLVLDGASDLTRFAPLARAGAANHAQLWLQLGHAGAMADPAISTPKGPSPLDLPGLTCAGLTLAEIQSLPDAFAQTAARAQSAGFGGVEIHAAHGFLLSQFLSPLFNRRSDAYGGALVNRMRLLLEVIAAVRGAVGPRFPVGVKLNATDQLKGGFEPGEALAVMAALDRTGLDLIDISGGTYFPGAVSSSDRAGGGPYFLDFASAALGHTGIPLMVTGGFKTRLQAEEAVASGAADVVGLARALVLDPDLPGKWVSGRDQDPVFPRFHTPPEGGVTAWFTMQINQIATARPALTSADLDAAIRQYEARNHARRKAWRAHFGPSE